MHNWLIFQYHRVRVHSNSGLLRGCQGFRPVKEPTHLEADNCRGTQEGR
jgi:hypothetical protein